MLNTVSNKMIMLGSQAIIRCSLHRRALQDIPDNLFVYWQTTSHQGFPGIPIDAIFLYARQKV